jgi:NAD(P)-dependent dehydrogenase (short-subunit alcohol dehydrogenase family)
MVAMATGFIDGFHRAVLTAGALCALVTGLITTVRRVSRSEPLSIGTNIVRSWNEYTIRPVGHYRAVTGANRGIGYHVAEQLASLGLTVLIGARNYDRGTETAAALGMDNHDVQPIRLDVTDDASITAAARHIEERYGRLDILVNNAAITEPAGSPRTPSTISIDTMRAVFDCNVIAVAAVTNAMLTLLRRSPAGRIVNVPSPAPAAPTSTERAPRPRRRCAHHRAASHPG